VGEEDERVRLNNVEIEEASIFGKEVFLDERPRREVSIVLRVPSVGDVVLSGTDREMFEVSVGLANVAQNRFGAWILHAERSQEEAQGTVP